MTTHPPFNIKPDYRAQHSLLQWQNMASLARRKGHYNLTTLWSFRKCWILSQKTTDYIRYLAFRRDLGYPVNSHQHRRLQGLFRTQFHYRLWQLRNPGSARLYRQLLNSHMQVTCCKLLQQRLQQADAIQFVGNSGNLINSKLGPKIDSAALVVRFNRCFSNKSNAEDTGQKTDIWVGAPDVNFKAPEASCYIITGPNMLNWLSRRPPTFSELTPLYGVPLAPWRELVKQLAAPPSAGLLVLKWFIQMAPTCEKWVCGFSLSQQVTQYHHADKEHKAVSRHNWEQEMRVLNIWLQQKLFNPGCRE